MLLKHFVFVITSLISLAWVSCGSIFGPNEVSSSDVSAISIPKREHGYQNLEVNVIRSPGEFDLFLQRVMSQRAWNDKDTFISVLQNENVDFENYNIVLFPHSEGSGSISVTPREPVWKKDKVVVIIDRDVPEVGTADMAYYAFAYKVRKSIKTVMFVVDKVRTEITNLPVR